MRIKASDLDLSYIAAFLDTDGCIMASLGRKTKSGGRIIAPGIVFYNRDLRALQWVQSLLGGNIYDKPRKTKRHSIARQLFLRSQKDEIYSALELLIPFLKIKKEQGILLKEYLDSRISRGWKLHAHLPVNEEELSIALKIRELNQGRYYKNSPEEFDGYEK